MLRLKGQTRLGEWVEFGIDEIWRTNEVKCILNRNDCKSILLIGTIRPADDPADLMLDEVLRLLNEREPGEALEVFRKHFGLINTWQCKQCGATSSHYSSQSVCKKCGSADIRFAVVMEAEAAAKYRTGEADEIRSTMLNRIMGELEELSPGELLSAESRLHYRLAVDACKDVVVASYNTPADDPRKAMLENVRNRFLWLFGNNKTHSIISLVQVNSIIDEMEAKL